MHKYVNGKRVEMTAEEEAAWLAEQPTPEEHHLELQRNAISSAESKTLEILARSYIEPEENIRLVFGGPENQSRWIFLGTNPEMLTYPYPLTAYDENGDRLDDGYVIQDGTDAQQLFAMVMAKEAEVKTAEQAYITSIKNTSVGEEIPADNR